jgi:hypothetical protein
VNRTIERRTAFVVDEADLQRLDAILTSFLPQHSYELKTSNDLEVDLATLDDVLAQPNSAARRFIALTGTTPWHSATRLTLTLRDGDYGNVKYEIVGDDKRVFDVANQLDEWIEEIRPWYSRIATADLVLIVMLLWGIAFGALVLGAAIYSIVTLLTTASAELAQPVPQTKSSIYIEGATIGVFFFSLLLAWIAGVVRRPLFPIASFRIGGGRKRDESAHFWRVFAGGTVIVPLLLALLLSLFLPR